MSADTSLYGLGAVLLHQDKKHFKPVVHTSRAMTDVEKRYAQIEKRPWLLHGPFPNYILGRQFMIMSHSLVPLINSKHLDDLPRILLFCLRLVKYDFKPVHVPGTCCPNSKTDPQEL